MNLIRISYSRSWCFPLLIIAVGLLAYSDTFQVPFVFDDDFNIVNNPAIKDLAAFVAQPAGRLFSQSRIVGYLSLALNYRLHGLDVAGYHLFNLVVHIANALLVYHLVRLTFHTPWFASRHQDQPHISDGVIALFSALVFVAHPVQTQAVTYIIQRLASLATFFYLISLVLYVKARLAQTREPKGPTVTTAVFQLMALLSAVMAMKTKEIAFTLPLVIVCYELIFFRGPLVRRVVGFLPLALTMLVIPLGLLRSGISTKGLFNDVGEVTRLMTPMPRTDYLVTQFRVIATYLRLLLLPVDQRVDYDYPVFHSLFKAEVFASFLLLLTLAGFAAVLLVRACRNPSADRVHLRLVAFGILWFFITLSVESSVIPIVDVIFEHRTYLPSVGFCMAVPLLVSAYLPRGGVVLLTCLVVLLGGATFKRNLVWGDEVRLWRDNEAKSPNKGRVYTQLGKAYRKIGRNDQALECYNRWLVRAPNDPETYNNRGNAYRDLGMSDKAQADYSRAIKIDPDFALPYFNRGTLYQDRKEYSSAIADYLRAVSRDPAQEGLFLNLGYAFEELGLHDRSIEAYTHEIALKPDSGEAFHNRGIAYRRKGMPKESESDLKEARRLGVGR